MADNWATTDPPTVLREKKAALEQVIELQRAFIESRGDADVTDGGVSVAGAVSMEEDAEELGWYNEQAARLDKFKAALNALRLQPDEFPVLVPQAWATRADDRAAAASRELLPLLLRVNARSQITFVPTPPSFSARPSGSDGDIDDESATPGGGLCVPRVFFMDSLRNVRLVQPSQGKESPAGSLGLGGAAAAGVAAAAAAAVATAPRALIIDLAGDLPLTCVTAEATELVEVLGAHLKRYNTSRVAQVRALKRLHELKCTAYDASDGTHEQLLRRLWSCGFGSELKCELTSERWVHLGFQSADPTKDLRGMGLLGLANLVYFGEHYADVFQRLVSAQRKRDYPLACAGINITALLLELLNMKDEGEPQTVQSRPPFDGQWGSDMFFFFCHMFYRERAFEDMYCFCLRRLDRMMVAMDANYAEFNTVVAALRSRLVEALAQRPLSFREFKRLMAAASSESEGSVHSSSGCDSTAVPAGTTSTTSLFGGGGGLWATGSSRRSSCSAASSADDGGHEGEQGEHQLARTIAEAMSIIPRSLESLKAQLRGTHGRTAASAEGAPRSSVPAPRSEPAAAEAADERRARPPPLVELT